MKCSPPISEVQSQVTDINRWFFSATRIVYAIHGGPMAGRINYQTASYQCIRPGKLWQCNWLEGSPPNPLHHPLPNIIL